MVKGSLAIFIFCLGLTSGLECHKCLGNERNCSKGQAEVCSPGQDACFIVIKKYHGLSAETEERGCGSSNGCRRYPMGFRGSLFRIMWCCSSDLCQPVDFRVNRDEPQNGVVCQTCIGNAEECGLEAPSEPCYGLADRCVQISQRFLPGEELEPIIKGCGNSSFRDVQVLYQVGKDFAFLDQKVCSHSNCNNRSFPDIPAGEPNGLQCYTCRDSGHGECAPENMQLLKCTGAMDRCMHIIRTENESSSVTLQKGCATESMCSRNTEIYLRLKREDSQAQCCKRSFCNQAQRPSGPEMIIALGLWMILKACQ